MGTNTDPYQPVERELKITRQILRVLSDFNNPVGIVTKNHLVTRDIDILADMAKRNLAEVFLSVTTLDKDLARTMEPRASAPHRRLDAIRALAEAGVPVGVMTAPMIPGLNDHEMEAILEAAAEAGATRAGFVVLRLPLEIKELFEEWLRQHRPDRAERVLSLIRQMRGGALYQSGFGLRMKGEGPIAELLSARFGAAVKRLGLNRIRYRLDTLRFRVPEEARTALVDAKRDARQMKLLVTDPVAPCQVCPGRALFGSYMGAAAKPGASGPSINPGTAPSATARPALAVRAPRTRGAVCGRRLSAGNAG